MTKIQKKVLKARVSQGLRFRKQELKKLNSIGSRLHMRHDRLFKTAFTNVRKEVRLFKRINSKLK